MEAWLRFELTRLGFATSVTFLAIACGQSAPPTPPAATFTLSGVVSETIPGGSRPLEASVHAEVQDQYGNLYGTSTPSDSAGHFLLTSLANNTTVVQLLAYKEGYVQQCASPRVRMLSDIQLDLQLVSRATLSASPESIAPPAPGFRSISGVVLEKTDAGTQPAAGAYVAYEWFEDISAAYTFSDAAGRYLLCRVPDGETVPICAEDINGFLWCEWVPAGQSTGVDITFP
jgi:hypothetical protein